MHCLLEYSKQSLNLRIYSLHSTCKESWPPKEVNLHKFTLFYKLAETRFEPKIWRMPLTPQYLNLCPSTGCHVQCIAAPCALQGPLSYHWLLPVLPHPFFSLWAHCGQHIHRPQCHLLWKKIPLDHVSLCIYPHIESQFWRFPPLVLFLKSKQCNQPITLVSDLSYCWEALKIQPQGSVPCLTRMESSFQLDRKAGPHILP